MLIVKIDNIYELQYWFESDGRGNQEIMTMHGIEFAMLMVMMGFG